MRVLRRLLGRACWLLATVLATTWLGACSQLASEPTPAQPISAQPISAQPHDVRQVKVAMYMTSWCPVCRKAREWLQHGGYDFVEYDVETDVRAVRLMRSVNPRGLVPMFEVGGRILIGFSPTALREAIRRAAIERAAVEPSATQQSAVQQSAVQQSAVQQSAVQQSAVQQSAVQQSAVQQSAVQQSAVQQSAVQQGAEGRSPAPQDECRRSSSAAFRGLQRPSRPNRAS